MKILTWNINGIRASKIGLKLLLDSLDADIICLQETKVTRDQLDEPTAIVEGYNSYFSFSRKKSGYSGVANFCKDTATPCFAEEGLTCLLNPQDEGKIGSYGNVTEFSHEELEDLDAEGRTIITKHKISDSSGKESYLVVINVYCPRVDPEREDRFQYKMRFLALLQTRAEALVEDGNHVIILGDLNLSHTLLDNCDPDLKEFYKKPSRMWMNQIVWEPGKDKDIESIDDPSSFMGTTSHTQGGCFIDTFRHQHPHEKEAYTNWCTLTSARETNFGRRLDYILGNVEFVQSNLTSCVIMAEVQGSDHCPVKADFSCVCVPAKKCPSLCTKYMPEFSGKQQKLSQFFTKKVSETKSIVVNKSEVIVKIQETLTSNCHVLEQPEKRKIPFTQASNPASKRQKTNSKTTGQSKSDNQKKLSTFFCKPQNQGRKNDLIVNSLPVSNNHQSTKTNLGVNLSTVESHKQLVVKDTEQTSITKDQEDKKIKNTSLAWKNLLKGPPTAPLCKGHSEPCVLRTVKKDGPNKGKQFFVCNRPEGHSSNPQARCDFFKWV